MAKSLALGVNHNEYRQVRTRKSREDGQGGLPTSFEESIANFLRFAYLSARNQKAKNVKLPANQGTAGAAGTAQTGRPSGRGDRPAGCLGQGNNVIYPHARSLPMSGKGQARAASVADKACLPDGGGRCDGRKTM